MVGQGGSGLRTLTLPFGPKGLCGQVLPTCSLLTHESQVLQRWDRLKPFPTQEGLDNLVDILTKANIGGDLMSVSQNNHIILQSVY